MLGGSKAVPFVTPCKKFFWVFALAVSGGCQLTSAPGFLLFLFA